jgi:hypothetical protein
MVTLFIIGQVFTQTVDTYALKDGIDQSCAACGIEPELVFHFICMSNSAKSKNSDIRKTNLERLH